jgi:hypothetical protein
MTGANPVLAGLAAARAEAILMMLDGDAPQGASWPALLSTDAPPSHEGLRRAWSELRLHQPDAPPTVSDSVIHQLMDLWPLLGPAEYLLGTGGDTRLMLDPATGLNAYGCSPRPRPWAVTFASSTASSISARGYAGAEEARCRILRDAVGRGTLAATHAAYEHVRQALLAHYELPPGTRIGLAASGTDAELAALALTWLADPGAPVVNVLVASEETGAGVPLAARGHHFATLTARGVSVAKGTPIAGFPSDVALAEVPVRGDRGAVRSAEEIDAECTATVGAALARGARVLLHVMDQSKTGLVAPSSAVVEPLLGNRSIDIVVDACQARLSAASVRRYFERGHIVLVTGSKFFTGPPFAGALLLPPAVAARLDGPTPLPAGLGAYFGRSEWPDTVAACSALPAAGGVGLPLRWEAALAEMRAFQAVPTDTVKASLGRFAATVKRAILANPDLLLHDAPPLPRPDDPEGWDATRTLFAFSVRAPHAVDAPPGERPLLDCEGAARLYAWLNSDLSSCLAEASDAERALGSRLFHIGQPVPVRIDGRKAGALRLSAGARLVSGEPSHAGLAPSTRIENELADALAVLAKISLILRHHDAIRAVNPRPRFRGGAP